MIEGAVLAYLMRWADKGPDFMPADMPPPPDLHGRRAVSEIRPRPRERLMKIETKRSIRTILQTAIGVAVALPMIVQASGIPEALPWVGGSLAVAGGFARVMALAAVQRILPSWLRTDDPPARTLGYRGTHGDLL